ncbi:MAG: 30S ribosomal protein S8 [Pseudomonadota bacterium]
MMTDPIADMLTRIRNAQKAGHAEVKIPASKFKQKVLYLLSDEGYLGKVRYEADKRQGMLFAQLKYDKTNRGIIDGVRRVSRPGLRVYRGYDELAPVRGGLGVAVLSTSRGVLSDREARKQRVGGEVLCEIW